VDQGSDTHQERTRQVDEPRQGVLSTSTHLWLLTAVATPGRQSFQRRQGSSGCQNTDNKKGCIIDEITWVELLLPAMSLFKDIT